MKILITGGTGFIGSHLVDLLKKKHEVILLVKEKKNFQKGIRYILHDLKLSFEKKNLPKVDCLIHLAQGNQIFPDGAIAEFKVNTVSTLELLEFCRKKHVKKFLYASTGGVYGFGPQKFKETNLTRSKNFYEGTKIAAENLIWQYRHFFDCIIMRFCFPYGPGTPSQRLFARFINDISKNNPILIKNNGNPRINPIYIDDLIEAMVKLLQFRGSITLNLGGDKVYSIKQIALEIGKLLGKNPKFKYKKEKPFNQNLVCDISLAQKLINFQPEISLKEGLKRMISAKKSFNRKNF